MRYILKDREAVEEPDLMKWARFMEDRHANIVKRETVGPSKVSTIFLGLDYQFGDGPPLIFETLVFDGKLDQQMMRYSTWEEAERGHARMVAQVKEAEGAS